MYVQCIKTTFVNFIACQIGTFGPNCNGTCGDCLHYDDCHHVNGTCITGCRPGYTGDICKTRK